MFLFGTIYCIGSGGIRYINQGHVKQCSSAHIFSEMCLSDRHFTVTNSSEGSVLTHIAMFLEVCTLLLPVPEDRSFLTKALLTV